MIGKLIRDLTNDQLAIVIHENENTIPSILTIKYINRNQEVLITIDDCELISWQTQHNMINYKHTENE